MPLTQWRSSIGNGNSVLQTSFRGPSHNMRKRILLCRVSFVTNSLAAEVFAAGFLCLHDAQYLPPFVPGSKFESHTALKSLLPHLSSFRALH